MTTAYCQAGQRARSRAFRRRFVQTRHALARRPAQRVSQTRARLPEQHQASGKRITAPEVRVGKTLRRACGAHPIFFFFGGGGFFGAFSMEDCLITFFFATLHEPWFERHLFDGVLEFSGIFGRFLFRSLHYPVGNNKKSFQPQHINS